MKIGIDARFLTHTQVGGFKTYSQNLIRALAQIDSKNEYIIYIDRPSIDNSLVEQDNISYRIVQGYVPGLKTAVREQIQLRQAIRRDQPDIVHFLCNTATVGIDTPYVITLHDTIQITDAEPFSLALDLGQHKRSAISAYSKWAIIQTADKAEKIITVSNYEKNKIAGQLNIAKENIHVTHLAPNTIFKLANQQTKTMWRQELSRDQNLPSRFILGVGYESRKNIPLLIEAFANVAPTHPDLSLVIVAAQHQASENFQDIVHDFNLDDRVKVLGSQTPEALAKLYNLAEIFVYPSERESFGLPPLEAMACGAPTIAMASSSLPEILGDGAFLVHDKDLSAWTSALERALLDDDLCQDLIQRGLRRAAQLTWSQCALATLEVYRAIAETHLLPEVLS
jgi:glycosyltransferase involved in cell wall biosynthesis